MSNPSKARKSPVPYGEQLGKLVRQLRNARGLSQETLAERADLAADTIRRLEHGRFAPSLPTLAKLVAGLDTSLSSLFATFEGSDDAITHEILAMGRRMSAHELAIAVRVLSVLAAMIRVVAGSDAAEAPQ